MDHPRSHKTSLMPYVLVSCLFLLASAGMYYLSLSVNLSPKQDFILSNSTLDPNPTAISLPEDSLLVATATTKPTLAPTPTPGPVVYSSQKDSFQVTYDTTYRKLAEFTQGNNHRYVFYRNDGRNEVVHAGLTWSWYHPLRKLTPNFRYDTSTQTVVDIPSDNLKYTLQCVHGGLKELKLECETFLTSFQINQETK